MLNGATPLYIAAQNGHADIIKLLLPYSAETCNVEVDCDKHNGFTPLYVAVYRGYVECVELLLAAGANPFGTNEKITKETVCGTPDIKVIFANRPFGFKHKETLVTHVDHKS